MSFKYFNEPTQKTNLKLRFSYNFSLRFGVMIQFNLEEQ